MEALKNRINEVWQKLQRTKNETEKKSLRESLARLMRALQFHKELV